MGESELESAGDTVRESEEIEEADMSEVGNEREDDGDEAREMGGVSYRDRPRSNAGDWGTKDWSASRSKRAEAK
jgi:hypothetical protein